MAHIEVAEQGAPKLAGDADVTDPEVEAIPPESDDDVPDVVWTPEEAQGVLQTVFNFGVFFYGPAWLCSAGDFARSGPNMARLLERVFPKATTGGPIGLGVDVAAVASDFGASVAVRRELMRKGPKQPAQVLQEFGLQDREYAAPEASTPASPPAQPVPAGESVVPASSSFKFSPEVRRALDAASIGGGGLGSMGLST